jgi:hypothetical protein
MYVIRALMTASYSHLFLQGFPRTKVIQACLGVLLDMYHPLSICRFPCDTRVNQSANLKREMSNNLQ